MEAVFGFFSVSVNVLSQLSVKLCVKLMSLYTVVHDVIPAEIFYHQGNIFLLVTQSIMVWC